MKRQVFIATVLLLAALLGCGSNTTSKTDSAALAMAHNLDTHEGAISGSGGLPPDFTFIDAYLATWDRFSQGANDLVPDLRRDKPRFQKQLAAALTQGDKRAASRLVFYAVVQVGGFIAHDSELGRAFEGLVGTGVPIFISKKGDRMYFAGDLYFWWENHKAGFETFPLYDEWRQREFARTTVIPMYESAAKKK